MIAQSDAACHLRVSLLTCTPGAELYSTFGHSALRVNDSVNHTDIIYNYGTFDFEDPAFYSKFIRGKLLYFVSVQNFQDFVEDYRQEQRGVTEQILNLSCDKKQKLLTALRENAKEENKYYKYDFIYDNCTTRLRDIVFKNADGVVATTDIIAQEGPTFRNLIHQYLDAGREYWSKLGIDILLGKPLDKRVSNSEAMFLPDNLLKGFDSTTIDRKALVSKKRVILVPTLSVSRHTFLSPFWIFVILFLVIVVLGLFQKTSRILRACDSFLFFVAGALGMLILFMWFGTDHPECRNNFNLTWALPSHLVIAFFIRKKADWVRYYFLANSIILVLLLIFWKWLPQQLNVSLIPLACLFLLRSFLRYKNFAYGD